MKTLDLVNAVLGTEFLNEEEAREVLIQKEFLELYNSPTHEYTIFSSQFIKGVTTYFSESHELVEGVMRYTDFKNFKQYMSHSLGGNIMQKLLALEGFKLPDSNLEDIPSIRPDATINRASIKMNVKFDELSAYYSTLLIRRARRLKDYNDYLNDIVFTKEGFELIRNAFNSHEFLLKLDNNLTLYIKDRLCIKTIVLGLVRKPNEYRDWFSEKQERVLNEWYSSYTGLYNYQDKEEAYYKAELEKMFDFKSNYMQNTIKSCETMQEFNAVYNEYSVILYKTLGIALETKDLRLFKRVSFCMYTLTGYKRRRTFI